MYKLTVISGPNQGTSYAIQDGENWIGRQTGNVVVLPSARVSKKHCVLVVNNRSIEIEDQGSSNGTFVNGVLTKRKKVRSGDRISVGEYVFEVSQTVEGGSAPAFAGNLVRLPMIPDAPSRNSKLLVNPSHLPKAVMPGGFGAPSGMPGAAPSSEPSGEQMPTDLKGKAIWYLEKFVMPVFYGLSFRHEWKVLVGALFGGLVVANLAIAVYPLLDASTEMLYRETMRRAQVIAREIADRNVQALSARAESKAEIGSGENSPGIRMAVLIDLDSRVIAPQLKLNRYVTNGPEARFSVAMRESFKSGNETGRLFRDGDLVVAIEPVKIFSSQLARNVVTAMAVVSIDASMGVPSLGDMAMVYSETLILTGALALIIFFIVYRLTLKPFQVLNDDMDKVLKGDLTQVTHEFKFEELAALWDVINSALQRAAKASDNGLDEAAANPAAMAEDTTPALRLMAATAKSGLVICDSERKIRYLNEIFEEASGIRSDGAIGQEVATVARDQSLGVFITDLFDRATPGSDGVAEDYEFSGVSFKVHALALGAPGAPPKAYAIFAVRNDG